MWASEEVCFIHADTKPCRAGIAAGEMELRHGSKLHPWSCQGLLASTSLRNYAHDLHI